MEQKYFNPDRKGCVLTLNNNYDNVSFTSETIDKTNFKTLVLKVEGWFVVTSDTKPTRVMNRLSDKIKLNTIKHFNPYYFTDIIIDILRTPDTFDLKRTGFLTFDYTIFVNKGIKWNKEEITMVMNDLIKKIHQEHFENPTDFEVFKTRLEFKERPILWNPDEYYPGDETDVNERL